MSGRWTVPDGRARLRQALAEHRENAQIAKLDGEVTFRDAPLPVNGLTPDDQVVMRFRDQVLASRTPVFGIASWMDAATANAALRRYLTYPEISG